MQQIDLIQAKLDIQELAARYAHHCDHPGWDGVVDLYTDDGVFDATTVYRAVYTGKEQLRGFYEGAPAAVAHHPTSQFTQVHDDGTATSSLKMIVLFHRQAFSVDYYWELASIDGQWKITKQTISIIGKVRFGAEQAAV